MAEGDAGDSGSAAALAPDGKARLMVHAVIHDAKAMGADFAERMQAAADRIISHFAEQAGAEPPEISSIAGAARPILEIHAIFFDDAERPRFRIRQWHALAPLDAAAARIAVLAFSLMTPALLPLQGSAPLAAGFQQGLRAAAAALSDGENATISL